MRLAEGNTVPNQESWMKIRVDLRTYKLVYEAGGQETMWRGADRDEEELRERARMREEERQRSPGSNTSQYNNNYSNMIREN